MAAAAAAAAGSDASDVEERIAVCIRIRPFSQGEAAQGAFCAWKPIQDYAGHLQQYTSAEEPVPGSTYAFGEAHSARLTPGAADMAERPLCRAASLGKCRRFAGVSRLLRSNSTSSPRLPTDPADHVFGSDQDTSSIYGEIAHPITQSVAEGYNGEQPTGVGIPASPLAVATTTQRTASPTPPKKTRQRAQPVIFSCL